MSWLAWLASHGAAFAAGVWLGMAIQRRNGNGPKPGASEQVDEQRGRRAAL